MRAPIEGFSVDAYLDMAEAWNTPGNRLDAPYTPDYRPQSPKRNRRGRRPPAVEPTSKQTAMLHQMHKDGRTQVAIAMAMGVPRSTIRIWYARRGLSSLTRTEGRAIGLSDTQARGKKRWMV